MTVKKGDTIYRKSDGSPVRVESTRAMPNTEGRQVRLYLNRGAGTDRYSADLFDGKLGDYSYYSLTQTPELARKWADTLQARADEQTERQSPAVARAYAMVIISSPCATSQNPARLPLTR